MKLTTRTVKTPVSPAVEGMIEAYKVYYEKHSKEYPEPLKSFASPETIKKNIEFGMLQSSKKLVESYLRLYKDIEPAGEALRTAMKIYDKAIEEKEQK